MVELLLIDVVVVPVVNISDSSCSCCGSSICRQVMEIVVKVAIVVFEKVCGKLVCSSSNSSRLEVKVAIVIFY